MIKLSIVLGILQTALLMVLVVEMTSMKQSSAKVVRTSQSVVSSPATTELARIDEAQLRRIVDEVLQREKATGSSEMVAQHGTQVRLDQQNGMLEQAKNKLAYLKSTGSMSQAQLRDFESSLAGLDPNQRRRMLGSLFKALNSGEVKGFL